MPISIGQQKLINIVQQIFQCQVIPNFRGFDWLKTDIGGRQEIDIWVPAYKLAIEYDGEQHFHPVCFGGISKEQANKAFTNRQRLDKIKDTKVDISDDVKYFVRFNYTEDINVKYVEDKLEKHGVIIPVRCLFSFDDMLDDAINPHPSIDIFV